MNHLNKKVVLTVGVIAIGLFLFKPALAVSAFPLLLLALCPLSMIFMMRGMHGGHGDNDHTAHASHTTAGPDVAKQIADLEEEVRILRATSGRQHRSGRTPPAPIDFTKPDGPGPNS